VDEAVGEAGVAAASPASRPQVMNVATLEKQGWTGQLMLVSSRASLLGAVAKFDFSWFIPALVKYRAPLRDVLIGSFFLQLVGLASPIFFQLVIDKVLVNQAMNTLEVLAIGLTAILVFETLLSALRNWLFAHTSNRVDAELSAALFRHLVALPLSYF
jgi:subfamily B ATP-binding cassette protein HlyB/CyaB